MQGSSRGITSGPDGALWFTEEGVPTIGRITTSGTISEYLLPPQVDPGGITRGADGALWFTEWERSQIGRITLAGQISEYPFPNRTDTFGGAEDSIASGPDGTLWFILWSGGGPSLQHAIGRMTTLGQVSEYPFPTGTSAGSLTSGPDGAVWYTQFAGDPAVSKIGRIAP